MAVAIGKIESVKAILTQIQRGKRRGWAEQQVDKKHKKGRNNIGNISPPAYDPSKDMNCPAG